MGKKLIIKGADFHENAIVEEVVVTEPLTSLTSYGNHLEVNNNDVAYFKEGANWRGGFIDLQDKELIEFLGAGQLANTSNKTVPVYAFFSSLPNNSEIGTTQGYISGSAVYADTPSTGQYPNVVGSKKVIVDSIVIPENARYLWINNTNLNIGVETYFKHKIRI